MNTKHPHVAAYINPDRDKELDEFLRPYYGSYRMGHLIREALTLLMEEKQGKRGTRYIPAAVAQPTQYAQPKPVVATLPTQAHTAVADPVAMARAAFGRR
jgi:hypothetical protein